MRTGRYAGPHRLALPADAWLSLRLAPETEAAQGHIQGLTPWPFMYRISKSYT